MANACTTGGLLLGLLLGLAACGNERTAGADVAQTRFPGQVSAGGGTSGEVLQRSQQAVQSGSPEGTPGIPEGSGGNTSGAAMGGTTPGAAVSQDAQQQAATPSGAMPGSDAKPSPEQAAAKAEQEKRELAASMDAVAQRWRARAAKEGWQTHPPTAVAAVPGISASGAQSGASGQPGGRLGKAAASVPVKSEKHGTAPPSEDVKTKPEAEPAGTAVKAEPEAGPAQQ